MSSSSPEASTTVPIDDRGLAYGDGLFETVLVRDGVAVLWEEHLARLARGAERLGIPLPSRERLDALPGQGGSGLVSLKLILTRGSGGRGYLPPDAGEPRLGWQFAPFLPSEQRWREGVTVRLCRLALSIQPVLAGLKHLNRLENVLARQEWRDTAIAEGLLCDTQGRLIEATCMNLFWSCEGRLETPRLDGCGVAGTLRQALMARLPIEEVEVGAEVLERAEAVWLGNSLQGLWPVIELVESEGRPRRCWQIGTLHRDLQHIAQPLLGYPAPMQMTEQE
ncbi:MULTISPECIES: aminodeoxychorismate lyase [Halomonadaceae]|uniref:aminodeoxychorismate lyase n=1 Tax=Halomonadaceae TaxID=28256 RepID=UPI001598AAE0|nr:MULTISPECIES: aminodeoxychorismate lyase [Halomonas]QJQ96375.1 aminodeoxychorismate lyase [Halomonas sp. PA5]